MSGRETADNYTDVVVMLNEDWRVIECRDGIQWILQYRGSPKRSRKDDWRGRSYCRTSEALRRCARLHAGPIRPPALDQLLALPDRFPERDALLVIAQKAAEQPAEHPVVENAGFGGGDAD